MTDNPHTVVRLAIMADVDNVYYEPHGLMDKPPFLKLPDDIIEQ